jgi:hypothetical protein
MRTAKSGSPFDGSNDFGSDTGPKLVVQKCVGSGAKWTVVAFTFRYVTGLVSECLLQELFACLTPNELTYELIKFELQNPITFRGRVRPKSEYFSGQTRRRKCSLAMELGRSFLKG